MPEPTINLQKDLELWVDFDTTYYDGQRNRVQDRSGHGRHPAASGGPTFGQQGPNSFEAVSFDGVDDKFSYRSPTSFDFSVSTIFCLFKANNSDRGDGPLGVNQRFVEIDHANRAFVTYNDSSNTSIKYPDCGSVVGGNGTQNEWIYFILRRDLPNGLIQTLTEDGELFDERTAAGTQATNDRIVLGEGFDNLKGEIAFFAFWERFLSSAEIQAVSRLTGPRRSQL
jgi:hypothetical protein